MKRSLQTMNLPGAIQSLDTPSGIPHETRNLISKFRQLVRSTSFLLPLPLPSPPLPSPTFPSSPLPSLLYLYPSLYLPPNGLYLHLHPPPRGDAFSLPSLLSSASSPSLLPFFA